MTTIKQLQRLPEQFSKNGLPYKIIQRNEVVALYSVGGIYYPDEFHYEVVRIIQVPEKEIMGRITPAHEALPSNEQFGKEGSRAIVDQDRAETYFTELTERFKNEQRTSKSYRWSKNSP